MKKGRANMVEKNDIGGLTYIPKEDIVAVMEYSDPTDLTGHSYPSAVCFRPHVYVPYSADVLVMPSRYMYSIDRLYKSGVSAYHFVTGVATMNTYQWVVQRPFLTPTPVCVKGHTIEIEILKTLPENCSFDAIQFFSTIENSNFKITNCIPLITKTPCIEN